jgi:regulator of protease activity HflC (stomatin/prohibitin superfamily)
MKTYQIAISVLAGVVTISMIAWGLPKYRFYRQDIVGQANLRQQEWEKQIITEEAKANLERARLDAQSEVERAKGVAEANQIIGTSLKDNDEYLRYLWISALYEESNSIIYVPTEANLPILEAGQR